MQTSILWEGGLPSKEEMEKMKQEGYLFRAVEGGWKICLKLHNTPTGTWYADNFSKSFLKEVELHQYLEEVEKRATWFEVPSKELRVYEAGQKSLRVKKSVSVWKYYEIQRTIPVFY